MAFIKSGATVLSFAEYQDIVDRDQRLFEANEGLTIDIVEDQLIRSTERILTEFRASDWWKDYYGSQGGSVSRVDIPALDSNKIIARKSDFTDLCVYKALAEYILPKVADFGNEESAERQKMQYYTARSSALFTELVIAGDWYDFDGDKTIQTSEKMRGVSNLRRTR
tara:strand:+ start:3636 stop:4136 length:501 start_codon:yes stop_codon:yes gene_type:complete